MSCVTTVWMHTYARATIDAALDLDHIIRIDLRAESAVSGIPAAVIDDAARSVATWGCRATYVRRDDVVYLRRH